jgi:tRNA pseudouridine38-40 synthase
MRNIKLTIEYDGSNYQGWQRQTSRQLSTLSRQPKTIQETIEKALQKILQAKIRLIGSGRTDAGVHALGQVANFKTNTKIPIKNLKQALNSLLPDNIVITGACEADLKFHSRFDAKSKIYRYTILNQSHPSAHWHNLSYFVSYKLDLKKMKRAARILLGRHDFRSFQAADKKPRDSIRTIKRIKVYRVKNFTPHIPAFPKGLVDNKNAKFIFIDIEADGFLYKMARNIVGTLIEIGRGKRLPTSILDILASRNRQFAGSTASGYGLCLLQVKY